VTAPYRLLRAAMKRGQVRIATGMPKHPPDDPANQRQASIIRSAALPVTRVGMQDQPAHPPWRTSAADRT